MKDIVAAAKHALNKVQHEDNQRAETAEEALRQLVHEHQGLRGAVATAEA